MANEKCTYENINEPCTNCAARGIVCSAAQKVFGPKRKHANMPAPVKCQSATAESPAEVIARYEEQNRKNREELLRQFFGERHITGMPYFTIALIMSSNAEKEHQHNYDRDEQSHSSS